MEWTLQAFWNSAGPFLGEIGAFTLKSAVIAGLVLGGTILVASFLFQMSTGRSKRSQIEVEKLNSRYRGFRRVLQSHLLGRKKFKALAKSEKKSEKKTSQDAKPSRVFVLDFDGDIRATGVESLREEVTALLEVAETDDEVVLRLESGGGLVTSYGLAAAQLLRIRNRKIKLTICVDKIAASGGYMMACVGERILAAPFAVLGSIGVIAQIPNFSRILKKHDVDYREITAGEFKRTVTVFGEITEPGLAKFREQIESTHQLFKDFVLKNRPKVDLGQVATGEHWYGSQAKSLGLVDEILTSDEYLLSLAAKFDVYRIKYHGRKKLFDRLSESASAMVRRAVVQVLTELNATRFH